MEELIREINDWQICYRNPENNLYHRVNCSASIDFVLGPVFWKKNNQRHRKNKPASFVPDGILRYYENDICLSYVLVV